MRRFADGRPALQSGPGSGVRIFYQKADGPVIRLPRCDPMNTECFRVKNLASGDQIIRVAFSGDPRVTRG